MAAIVVQFGLAMIPFSARAMSCGFTSETTSGTCGSIRQHDELSTTMAPAAANLGANARDVLAPAEKITTSKPVGSAVVASSTVIERPAKSMVDPAERAEAKKRNSLCGNSRSASSERMTLPTIPVAPTRPMLGILLFGTRSG